MELDLKKAFKIMRKNVQNFEVRPWMVIVVSALMIGLLALGLMAWVIPSTAEKVAEAVTTPSVTPAPTQVPTSTPEPTPTVVPSPTPIPQVWVVWTAKVSVYLLSEPGTGIIAAIPNGEPVEMRTGVAAETAGGITWRPVRYQMVNGWLAQGNVYQVAASYHQIGEPGTSLFRDPAGSVAFWLAPGTPYHSLELDESTQWQKILLPDGSAGWVNRQAEAVP